MSNLGDKVTQFTSATEAKDQELVARMINAYTELCIYNEYHPLISFMEKNDFGRLTITTRPIAMRSFLKRYDRKRKNVDPRDVCEKYTTDLERAIKKLDNKLQKSQKEDVA